MKILFFSPYYYPYTSGVTTYPQKILEFLSKNHQVEILTFNYDKKLQSKERLNNYLLYRMNWLIKISKGFISPQSLYYFFKKSKSSNLIILNQPNFEGLLLALMGKIFRKKIFSIYHCQVFLPQGLINKIINFFLNVSIYFQLILSDKIIGYTEDYYDSIDFLKPFKLKACFELPPIEMSEPNKKFLKRLLKKKGKNIWIGYAGRTATEKGIEYLIYSIRNLKATLVFAGPYGKDVAGENNYFTKIKLLLNRYKIKYLFLGNLDNKHLASFYRAIDLLTLSSINQTEAFGMVQVEAMLSGTPVVASNLPGVRIPIKLTKMGILVEPKNSQQLSQAIIKILKNKNKFTNKKLVNNAKKIFDIKKTYRFYERLITLLY